MRLVSLVVVSPSWAVRPHDSRDTASLVTRAPALLLLLRSMRDDLAELVTLLVFGVLFVAPCLSDAAPMGAPLTPVARIAYRPAGEKTRAAKFFVHSTKADRARI